MKCYICDKDLSDKETIYDEQLKGFEPCTTCLDIAMEAAYSDGFTTEDDEYSIVDEEFDDQYIDLPYVQRHYDNEEGW